MRILGIDPGIARVGWGVVDQNAAQIKPVAYDCFETSSKQSTPARLSLIYQKIIQLISEHQPHAMAIEELFFNTNAKTAFVVGQARGVIMLAAEQHHIPIEIYTPLQVKISITGYGRAEKDQVGKMVSMLLGLKTIPKPDDTADALAIACSHAFSHKLRSQTSNV